MDISTFSLQSLQEVIQEEQLVYFVGLANYQDIEMIKQELLDIQNCLNTGCYIAYSYKSLSLDKDKYIFQFCAANNLSLNNKTEQAFVEWLESELMKL